MEWCYYSWTFLLLLDKLLNQPALLALDEPFGRAGDGLFSASLSVILMVTQIKTINNLLLKICYEIIVDETLLCQIISFLNLFMKIYFFLNKYNNFYIA